MPDKIALTARDPSVRPAGLTIVNLRGPNGVLPPTVEAAHFAHSPNVIQHCIAGDRQWPWSPIAYPIMPVEGALGPVAKVPVWDTERAAQNNAC